MHVLIFLGFFVQRLLKDGLFWVSCTCVIIFNICIFSLWGMYVYYKYIYVYTHTNIHYNAKSVHLVYIYISIYIYVCVYLHTCICIHTYSTFSVRWKTVTNEFSFSEISKLFSKIKPLKNFQHFKSVLL